MSIASSYLIYLTVFRLSIIVTGALSIFLGYRLYLKGIGPSEEAKTGAQLEAAARSYRLTLRNAAPGTFFALFGAIIIGANFYQGGPSLTLKTLAEAVKLEGEAPAGNGLAELAMKGGGSLGTIKPLTEAGKHHERRGDALRAKAAYRVIIFFSGHGHTECYAGEYFGYIVPLNGTQDSATHYNNRVYAITGEV